MADMFYRRDVRGRSAVILNLCHILEFKGVRPSEETLERMARKTFQHFGKYLVDFFRFKRLSRDQVDRIVSIEHMEYVEQARALDRGVLVVTAHLGSWEIGGAVCASLGCPMHVVIFPERNQKTAALFQKRRENRGMTVVPLGQAGRHVLRALRDKKMVALLADRDYGARNNSVTFFGVPVHLPRGPATLCARTGAPILPGFLLREDDDTFLLRFHQPIVPGKDESVVDIQHKICRVLEQEIGERPSQWFMFDEFWTHK